MFFHPQFDVEKSLTVAKNNNTSWQVMNLFQSGGFGFLPWTQLDKTALKESKCYKVILYGWGSKPKQNSEKTNSCLEFYNKRWN